MATQNAGRSLPVPSRACCRCDRNGRCRNCVCCKERRRCVSCLPGRLGRCENYGVTSSSGESSADELMQDSEYSIPSSDNDDGVPNGAAPSSGSVVSANYATSAVVVDGPSSSCNFLPSFNMMCDSNFIWGDVAGESFVHSVTCCYDEVVHWRKVLFKIPQAKCGRAFVAEQARLFLWDLHLNVLP